MPYLEYFPQPLLEDLLRGRCLPFIGAGFSLNADIPSGKVMPTWDQLGKVVANSLPAYTHSNGLDTLSAYAYEYSRSKLVEKLFEELLIGSAQPGPVYKAFCNLPFDIVCSTNFDSLLEDGYRGIGKFCRVLVSEEQLPLENPRNNVRLL